MVIYNMFVDPCHGWLKVKKSELARIGIANKISEYSYMRGDYAYIEQDCDLTLFMATKKKLNEPAELKCNETDKYSKIRSYDRYVFEK